MTTFPKYDRYKDSGVEWLGDVPEHWQVCRNLGVFDERKECNQPDAEMLSVTVSQGIIRQSEITSKKDSSNDDKSKYKVVRVGDLAYNKMRAWQGALGVSAYDGIVSPAYVVLAPRNRKLSKYFHYLFRTPQFITEANRLSYGLCDDMNSLRYEHFKTSASPIPPDDEIDRIVAFLDQKTAEIDALIAIKQRQLELLDEQKAILINRAVTRGLNPHAKLKPSGIEWIGDIPEHWERMPIKNLLSSIDYGTSQSSHEEGKIPVLSMANIQNGIVTAANTGGIDSIDPWLLIRKYDILFTRTNGNPNLVGKVGIVTEEPPTETTFASYLVRFRAKSGTNPVWLHRLLWSEDFWRYARSFALINLQTNLNSTKYVNLQIAVPPFSEQIEIAKWCDKLIEQEKRASQLIAGEIQSLKALRTTLVAHVVTGRIKV
jgi:type I restriction enzyme S subunit